MMGGVSLYHLEDLVECKICYALVTYEHRPIHITWHANIRASLNNVKSLAESMLQILQEVNDDEPK